MNQKQIKHITNDHYRELKKFIQDIAGDFDVETIHQFRVEYKKLRALLRMLSQKNETGREIKISKRLKNAYNISGSIRDLQLQQQRISEATIRELKKPEGYLILLQKEMDNLKPEFSEIISERPVEESKKKTDAAIPDKFPLSDLDSYIRKKWIAVNEILISDHFSDDNIHAIRKNLKDLLYNLKIYNGVEKDIIEMGIWNGKNGTYFYKLLEELGNFQDRCTAIALMKSYWLRSLDAYNRVLLFRIKKRWTEQKLEQKQLLIDELRTNIMQSPTA